MKKIISLVLIFGFIFSMTCLAAQRKRVAEIEPKDRNIAMTGFFSLFLNGHTEFEGINIDKVVGWTNEEIFYEDDFGRIVSSSKPIPNPGVWVERTRTCSFCGWTDTYFVNVDQRFPYYCKNCGWQLGGRPEFGN